MNIVSMLHTSRKIVTPNRRTLTNKFVLNHANTKSVSWKIPPLVIYNWRQGCIWISHPTFDVPRVETDLLAPVSKRQLTRDHLRVDYGPVKFDRDSQTLWLPWDAVMLWSCAASAITIVTISATTGSSS